MKKCKECIFVYASFDCARDLKTNKFTGVSKGLQSRNANKEGGCSFYVPKPEGLK